MKVNLKCILRLFLQTTQNEEVILKKTTQFCWEFVSKIILQEYVGQIIGSKCQKGEGIWSSSKRD